MSSTFSHLAPIDARRRADQVRDRIVELIRSGRYQEGDQLPTEPQLMAQFGVGRSSVRAAVQSLAGLGVIELRRGKGAFIRTLTIDDVVQLVQGAVTLDFHAARELHEVRTMIETTAAHLAANRHTGRDLRAMQREIDRYRQALQAGRIEASIDADLGFHRAIVNAARNPVLLSLLDSITPVLRDHRREYGAYDGPPSVEEVDAEHRAILAAIASADAECAVRQVANHMNIIWTQIERVAQPESRTHAGAAAILFDAWGAEGRKKA